MDCWNKLFVLAKEGILPYMCLIWTIPTLKLYSRPEIKEHWQFCHRLFSKETLQITWSEGQCERHRKNKAYIQFFLSDRLFATASDKCFEVIKFGVPFPSLFCDWFRLRLPLVLRTMLPAGVEAASCPFCFTCRLFCNSKNYMKNIRTHTVH